jgi:hypothetical protein
MSKNISEEQNKTILHLVRELQTFNVGAERLLVHVVPSVTDFTNIKEPFELVEVLSNQMGGIFQ